MGKAIVTIIIYVALIVFMIACWWKIFEKAGKPGWAAIVPIYNIIVYLEIVGKPIWWIVLLFIPFVNFIVIIILSMELAVCFGKSKGWGFVFLVLLGVIGAAMLGFGDATYTAPAGAAA